MSHRDERVKEIIRRYYYDHHNGGQFRRELVTAMLDEKKRVIEQMIDRINVRKASITYPKYDTTGHEKISIRLDELEKIRKFLQEQLDLSNVESEPTNLPEDTL